MYSSMYLAISPEQFNIHHIMLSEKTKNNVMEGGDFFRLYYSESICNSNGLFIYFNFKNIMIEKYFNKIKCTFNESENINIIRQLKNIERKILEFTRFKEKQCEFRIEEQLNNKYIKIFTEKYMTYGKNKNINIVLKISGIWNNYTSCGLTFRFYIINHQLKI